MEDLQPAVIDSNIDSNTTGDDLVSGVQSRDVIALPDFISNFGAGLLNAVRQQNPSIYDGQRPQQWDALLDALSRQPFPAQREVIHAVTTLLTQHAPGGVINAEMGTGKTLMGIGVAVLLHHAGYPRTLVIAPPHLVYKWRREIKTTVPVARVWILNGPDTLRKLLQLRVMRSKPAVPEFFILGRVRMRMGFDWKPAFARRVATLDMETDAITRVFACCPSCGEFVSDEDGNPLTPTLARVALNEKRRACHCGERLWTLAPKGQGTRSMRELVKGALLQMPTVGEKTAERLLSRFGESMLADMLQDNLYEFINLMDDSGELVFSDRQAKRMERALAHTEISFGQGGYQASEFIKRYLPQGYFGLLIADEGHEYKNENSAQGQAMGVLARKASKTLLLTGTLMGGYADDLYHLLYRLNPSMLIEDGFNYNGNGSMAAATMAFMREHGVLIDIHRQVDEGSHRTAKGDRRSVSTVKGPGFGPKGIMRYVVPYTAFLKLSQIGQNVLPPYDESLLPVALTEEMAAAYRTLESTLTSELRAALRCGDKSLLGVVLNALLAWPECCFRPEIVRHPRTKRILASVPALLRDDQPGPKEEALLRLVRGELLNRRRTLVYTTYTGTRDTSVRLKNLFDAVGVRASVLRASVPAEKREDWVADQLERGAEVIITNPELVKTGLDLLEFPTIAFLQSGFNTYTLQQAARRSWRIGQTHDVTVRFLAYEATTQMRCLKLMGQKIAVSQSTSGDMPESGLDILNQGGESIEVALARQLVSQE
ncbi:SNF2-related protein [Paraburkholderia phenoliruptrix]|uniref:SNF2-like protein n=2 Tax=Paraburkholderia phenoliruptrix TaxID=252970 RepID=K0DRE7_9BURK|nr:SNF2-related protein [Paraburkholderia phenoliruptrix]AFT86009.1 SNF2-like protein [Paraburkholderia phenoliruptrix BR3459a]CAB4048539.1 hypothetical protein LMG9964_02180 [Paraburkholderia phenoliruptrix]